MPTDQKPSVPVLVTSDQPEEERRFKHKPTEGLAPGTVHYLPDRERYLDWVRFNVTGVAKTHELGRIETPILDKVATLTRAFGEDSPLVNELLYKISSKGGEAVALRPDVRPGIARAFALNEFSGKDKPLRLWHRGPVFRNVALKAGVQRQFEVFGFELIGELNPVLDAQIIQMAWKVIKNLGLEKMVINVNSVGCLDCRPEYLKQLKDHYENRQNALCKECRKYRTSNPLKLLACEEEKCVRHAKEAPQIIDNLCEACHKHFSEVLEFLDDLEIPYSLNPQLVHDMDYYTRTVFAILKESGERSSALFTGGRYDDLVEKIGGRPTPAVGVTGGIDRLVLAIQEQSIKPPIIRRADVYLAQLSAMAKKKALKVFEMLRDEGIHVIEGFGKNAITLQMEQAVKLGVPVTLILGQKEALEDTIILRDMLNGVQETVPLSKMITEVKKRTDHIRQPFKVAAPLPVEGVTVTAGRSGSTIKTAKKDGGDKK